MNSNDKLDKFLNDIEPYLILVIISSFVGVVCGVIGAFFIKTIDVFINLREVLPYIILAMPIIGIIVVYISKKYKCNKEGTTLINKAITKNEEIPSYLVPTLFISTTLSHFAGASVGRMEAPIKMGGSIGNYISKFFNLKKEKRNTIIASGVAALFSSVFGAPLTGTVFAWELCISKQNKKPIYILPVLLSAAFSRFICFAFGVDSFIDRMLYLTHASIELKQLFLIALLIILCIIFMLFFNKTFEYIKELFQKIKNEYLRIIIGSLIMITAIILLNTTLFCGNNTDLVKQSLEGNEMWYIFLVKTILTALCLGIGFKCGNIGPAFIAGATFGILISSLMGLDPMTGAAIGAVSLFGGATGCFITATILGIEIFGLKGIILYIAIAIIIKHLIKTEYIKREF